MMVDTLKNQIVCIESGSRGKGGALIKGIPSLGAEHLQSDGNINWDPKKMKYISPSFFKTLKAGILQEGDVLVVKDGATTGKISYVSYLPSCAAINEHVFLLRTKSSLHSKFLFYYFQSSVGNQRIMEYYHGATVGGIGKNIVNIKIPLPPLNEQRHVAAILDKIGDLIAKRRQQLDKLDEMVKARFVEMFGDPVENPMGWEKIALGKRCDIVTGNTPSRAEPENYGNFIEWIKSDNINTPALLLTEAQEYLSEKGFHKCRFVEAGSLLMTCIAGSINCIGNVAVTDRRVAFNQQINAIVPKQDDVLYLYWLIQLSKPAIHSTINMALKGILSKGQLSEMVFPFPPLELQNQFSVFVKETEKIKATISRSLEKLETLKKALMQEYFGEEI